jgi:hypothetical protein
MTKITTVIVSLLLAAVVHSNAAVAYWSFTNYTGATTISANQGSGTLTETGRAPTATTGTTLNEIAGYDTNPGGAMSIANPSRSPVLTTSFVLQFSQGGMTDFVLTYDYNQANTAYSQQWQWSTNGTTYNTFTTITSLTTGWQTATVDFSSVSALEGAGVTSIWIRDNITAGNNGNHTIAFDNIQINAVPEPTTIAASIFGGIFALTALGRRILKNRS